MRKLPIAALALMLSTTAHATDKGDLKGCYVEAAIAGTFLASGSREPGAGLGGGCDVVVGNILLGGGVRADFSDWRNAGSAFAKIGLAINPHATVYGLAAWQMPDWKPWDAGQLALGGGAEISLSNLVPRLSAFAEATTAVAKFGTAATRDDVAVRLGIRWRF